MDIILQVNILGLVAFQRQHNNAIFRKLRGCMWHDNKRKYKLDKDDITCIGCRSGEIRKALCMSLHATGGIPFKWRWHVQLGWEGQGRLPQPTPSVLEVEFHLLQSLQALAFCVGKEYMTPSNPLPTWSPRELMQRLCKKGMFLVSMACIPWLFF